MDIIELIYFKIYSLKTLLNYNFNNYFILLLNKITFFLSYVFSTKYFNYFFNNYLYKIIIIYKIY